MKASKPQLDANKRWYEKNKQKILERHRSYSRTVKGKEVQAKKDKKSQRKHSLHWYARSAVARAVKKGILQRMVCQAPECISLETTHAHHHWGYKREHWLHVIWLCPKHHIEIHNIYENPDLINKQV